MKKKTRQQNETDVQLQRQKRSWRAVAMALAAAVLFNATCAPALPAAAALESDTCPLAEHTHTEACYVQEAPAAKTELACAAESLSVHRHTEECRDSTGALLCGYADFVLHTHNDACYNEDGALLCTLPEIAAHTHGDGCYAEPEDGGEPVLVCGLQELAPHTHTEDCFDENGSRICGKMQVAEHVHGEACFQTAAEPTDTPQPACGMEEHTHTEECNLTPVQDDTGEGMADAVVQNAIALIEALPAVQEIEEKMAAFEAAGDEDGSDAYLAELTAQAKAAYEAYAALTEEQQAQVTNADALMALEPLWSVQVLPEEEAADDAGYTRLFQYAEENGGKVEIKVLDNGSIMEPDPDSGEYIITAGKTYHVNVTYTGDKLEKGKYYVTFASNIDLGQKGTLSCNDNQGNNLNIGEWHLEEKEDGTAWLVFDITKDLSNHSGIVLTANVTCKFDYADLPLEFDGNIKVQIQHNEDSPDTEVDKTAEEINNDRRIRWNSKIYGNSGSKIIGSTVTDTITTTESHFFSEADMEAGIQFEAVQYRPESPFTEENVMASHKWTVRRDDAGLTWTEGGWSYTMPETITCEDCRELVTLGNDDWLYSMTYTSTIKNYQGNIYNYYENKIVCDGKQDTASTYTGVTRLDAWAEKTGVYQQVPDPDKDSDPEKNDLYANDRIDWTIRVKIPAARQGEKFDYFWYLVDVLWVEDSEREPEHPHNPMSGITVTATIGKDPTPVSVPQYETVEAEPSDVPLCWRLCAKEAGSEDREIDFYTKCNCDADNCQKWTDTGGCGDKTNQGFCRCWSLEQDVEITITYSTPVSTEDGVNLADKYGGQGAQLVNKVVLWNKEKDSSNKFQKVRRDQDQDEVSIPGVFTKKLTGEPGEGNNYVAQYTITVNEAMADLRELNSLEITDIMSPTLSLTTSPIQIQYEDADGTKRPLPADRYEVSAISITEEGSKKFTITLKKEALGPYKYTLIYGAKVSGDAQGLTYQNSASVYLFGKTQEVKGTIQQVPSAAITARTYAATLLKLDADRSKRLGLNGAVFELYKVGDTEPMHTYTTGNHTDENGLIHPGIAQIETDTNDGVNVILHSHTLYYLKETKAPEGYLLDSSPHYFWFCNDTNGDHNCDYAGTYGEEPYKATAIYSGVNPDNIDLYITNVAIKDHELPKTGGGGTAPYTVAGALLTGTAMLWPYRKRKRRKKEPVSC